MSIIAFSVCSLNYSKYGSRSLFPIKDIGISCLKWKREYKRRPVKDIWIYKLFKENEPWKLAKENKNKCENILYNCCNIIFNINNLLKPYLIDTTKKVEKYLNNSNNDWNYKEVGFLNLTSEIKPLFVRYDKSLNEVEKQKTEQ